MSKSTHWSQILLGHLLSRRTSNGRVNSRVDADVGNSADGKSADGKSARKNWIFGDDKA